MAAQSEEQTTGTRPVQWYESLQFRLTIGLLVILGILILAFMTVNQTLLRSVLIENNFDLVEQTGNSLVTELGQQIEATESLTRSIASLGERLPFDETLYKGIVPHLMKTEGDEEIIAGGGIWPEPFKFSPDRERRSFFWARKYDDELKYYDDYNAPEGLGYHREEWYVPAKYVGRDRCFWSKSYMDPYSLEPMVTCSVPMHRSENLVGVATVDVKLTGLQQFFASKAEKLGGYAFAVDRNNKFLSYPDLPKVKEGLLPRDESQAEDFITVQQFADRNPQFQPVAGELGRLSGKLLSLARGQTGYDPRLAERIARESYQINAGEAEMIAATFVDPLSPEKAPLNEPFETSARLSMKDDLILGEPVLVSMFIMPKVYWKIVVVTPQRPVIDRASEVTEKILYVLITIILVSMAGAFIWLRRVLVRPLVSMTDEIRDAPLLELNLPTAQHRGFTEIDLLGSTINRMRNRLSQSFNELRASENRFRLIAESLPEGLVITRRSDGVILYLNSRLRRMFAIPEDNSGLELKFLDFYGDPQDRADLLAKLRETDVVSDFVVPARRHDGSTFWMSVSTCSVIFGGEDALVTGVIDVTQRKEAEDEIALYRSHLEQMVEERTAELESAKRVALQAAAAKQNFLANMSHEIRTPLNSIVGIGHLLMMKEHLPAQNRYLMNLNKSGKILLKIINDILDITKMDVGKLKAEEVEFDLDDVLDDLSIHIRPLLAEKDIDAYILRPAGLNRRLIGDPLKLQQVLLNLITNAVKFTHRGHVQCSIDYEIRARDGKVQLRFDVEDTGIGIASDKMDTIFNAFTQADSATTREYGGTGLGLAICKTLVNLMGGTIGAESLPGRGSRFHFDVLLTLADAETDNPFGRLDIPVRAMILSDDSREIDNLGRLFSGLGIEADARTFDPASLASAEESSLTGHPHEIMVMDWDQDEEKRNDVLSRLKETGLRDKLVLIAITQAITEADEVLLGLGDLDAILSRPVRISRLKSSISTLLNMEADRDVLSMETGTGLLEGIRILLVEDNEQNQFVVEELLGAAGAEITIANNGSEALELVGDTGVEPFDVVLMDLHMPVMDGFEAARKIRERFPSDQLPIIALTAEVFEEVVEKCRGYGMDDYLAKPMNPSHAISVISKWAGKPAADIPQGEGENLPSEPISGTFDHISLDKGLANLDQRQDLLIRLLRDFVAKYDNFSTTLDHMMQQPERSEAARYIHTFCGLAATIGAAPLAEEARCLKRALDKADETDLNDICKRLSSDLESLITEIREILARA